MKQYKYKGFVIIQVTHQGDKWYNVFKGDTKLDTTKELNTLNKAKEFVVAQG